MALFPSPEAAFSLPRTASVLDRTPTLWPVRWHRPGALPDSTSKLPACHCIRLRNQCQAASHNRQESCYFLKRSTSARSNSCKGELLSCRDATSVLSRNKTSELGGAVLKKLTSTRISCAQSDFGDGASQGQVAPSPVPLDVAVTQLDQALEVVEKIRNGEAAAGGGVRGGPVLGPKQALAEEKEASDAALGLARRLADSGTLKFFGRGALVPRRTYSMDELLLHKIDPSRLLSPTDATLGSVRNALQLGLLAALGGAWLLLQPDQWQMLYSAALLLFLGTADQVTTGGAVESTIIDSAGHAFSQQYRERVAKHEAGHFLIAYLLGVLPSSYTVSSLDAVQRYGVFSWRQAGTALVDAEFQQEFQSGKISSEPLICFQTLDKVTCIALAGVCSEYVLFGRAEGGLSDIQQLDGLFRSLRFTQKKSDEVVRWAVLNTVTLLRTHKEVLLQLGDVMQQRRTVGACIATVEEGLGS